MMGGAVWQEVVAHREEEGRLVQVIFTFLSNLVLSCLVPMFSLNLAAIVPLPSSQGDVKGESPTVTFLTSIPVHVCETLMDYLTSWLAVTGWKEEYGPWIYAVLTRYNFYSPSVGLELNLDILQVGETFDS